MKRLIPFLFLGVVIHGCWTDQTQQVMNNLAVDTSDMTDTTSFPLIIDDGTKIIYQFGHLTADKGLKLYFDTIPYPAGGLKLDEDLRLQLSSE